MKYFKNIFLYVLVLICTFSSKIFGYDRINAQTYADEHVYSYNSHYHHYTDAEGGDCTNFISQCLIAGGIRFANNQGFTNYENGYTDEPNITLIRAADLPPALTTYHGATISVNTIPNNLKIGDVISLGSPVWNREQIYTHSVIVVETGSTLDTIRVNAHTTDRYHEPLSTYAVDYNIIRYIHIPDSPVVKEIIVSQGGQTRYWAKQEFNTSSGNPYLSVINSYSVAPGTATVSITFDTPMNTADGNTLVRFGKNDPYTAHSVNPVNSPWWYFDKIWGGNFTIPQNDAAYDGSNHFSIVARGKDLTNLDRDENLTVYNPGPDKVQWFAVDTSQALSGFGIPVPDTTAPLISATTAQGIAPMFATIVWNTNEFSTSQVEYGLTTAYGLQTTLNTAFVTNHSVTLTGLQYSTTYHFLVKSQDAAANLATSGDYYFVTRSTGGYIFNWTVVASGTETWTQTSVSVVNSLSFYMEGKNDVTETEYFYIDHTQNNIRVTLTEGYRSDAGLSYTARWYKPDDTLMHTETHSNTTGGGVNNNIWLNFDQIGDWRIILQSNAPAAEPTSIAFTYSSHTFSYSEQQTNASASISGQGWVDVGQDYNTSYNVTISTLHGGDMVWGIDASLTSNCSDYILTAFTQSTSGWTVSGNITGRLITPPAPTIVSPTHPDEDEWYSDNCPAFEWQTASAVPSVNITGYSYVLDSSSYTVPDNIPEGVNNSASYTDISEGISYFHLKAQNSKGQWTPNAHYRIMIDTTPPAAPINLLADGSNPSPWRNSKDYTFTWTNPEDISGINCAYFAVNLTTDTIYVAYDNPYYVDMDELVSAGENVFYFWLEDTAWNWNDLNFSTITLRYDATPPRVEISTPVANSWLRGLITVSGTVQDYEPGLGVPFSGFNRYEIYYGLGEIPSQWTQVAASTTPYEGAILAVWDTTASIPLANGELYTLKVKGYDNASNVSERTLYLNIDNTAPVLTNINAGYVTASYAEICYQTDDLSDSKVEYGLTTSYGQSPQDGSFTNNHKVVLTGLLSPATYHYRVISANKTGLTAVSADYTFFTPFNVVILTMHNGNGYVIDGSGPINTTITNPAISMATFLIDGSPVYVSTTPPYNWYFDIGTVGNGMHTIKVISDGLAWQKNIWVDNVPRTVRMAQNQVMSFSGINGASSSGTVVYMTMGQPAASSVDGASRSNESAIHFGFFSGIDWIAPAAVTDLFAAPGPGRGEVTLKWMSPGDDGYLGCAAGYVIKYATFSVIESGGVTPWWANAVDVSSPPMPLIAGSTQSMTVTGLVSAVTYYFSIKSVDEVGNVSDIDALSSAPGQQSYSQPRGAEQGFLLVVSSCTGKSVWGFNWKWVWQEPPYETQFPEFEIYTSTYGYLSETNIGEILKSTSACTIDYIFNDTSLNPNSRYTWATYQRKLKINYVYQTHRGEKIFTKQEEPFPGYTFNDATLALAPQNLTSLSQTPDSILLSWSDDASHPAVDYAVYRTTDTAGPWTTVEGNVWPGNISLPLSSLFYTDTNLLQETTYWYKVGAHNFTGDINISKVIFVKTKNDVTPPVITSFTVTADAISPNNDGVNDTTTIYYKISEAAITTAGIYDSNNVLIKTLVEKEFADDFDDKDSYGWISVPGNVWSIENSEYKYRAFLPGLGVGYTGYGQTLIKNTTWQDIVFETKVRFPAQPYWRWVAPKIIFKYKDNNNYYSVGIEGQLPDGGPQQAYVNFTKTVNSISSYIGSNPIPTVTITRDVWYRMKLAVEGSSITFCFGRDGETPAKFTINDSAPMIDTGKAGLSVNCEEAGAYVTFDDVKINDYKDTNVWDGKQNDGLTITPDGNYTVKLKSTDISGNVSTSTLNILLDTIAPGQITGLHAEPLPDAQSMLLYWTAPGDNAYTGEITDGKYRVKYSTYLVDGAVCSTTIVWSTNTLPGTMETAVITALTKGLTYYFIVKTEDRAGNSSQWSDIASERPSYVSKSTDSLVSVYWQGATLSGIPVSTITIDIVPSTSPAATVALSTAASASPGVISLLYDLNPHGAVFPESEPAILTFYYSEPPLEIDETTLKIYRYDELTGWQAIPAYAQNTVENWIKVKICHLSLYAIFADIKSPQTTLNAGDPRWQGQLLYVNGNTPITLVAVDDLITPGDGVGLGVKSITYWIDVASPTTSLRAASGGEAISSFTLTGLTDGIHTVHYYATDILGNVESLKTKSLIVDNTPPRLTYHPERYLYQNGATVFATLSASLTLESSDPDQNILNYDFTTASCLNDFNVISGSWTLDTQDRTYIQTDKSTPGISRSVLKNLKWMPRTGPEEYSITAKVHISSYYGSGYMPQTMPLGSACVIFRYLDTNRFYAFVLSAAAGQVRLVRYDGIVENVFGFADYPVDINRWYDVAIEICGGKIKSKISGVTLIDTIDPNPVNGDFGVVGFGSEYSVARFAILSIKRPALSGETSIASGFNELSLIMNDFGVMKYLEPSVTVHFTTEGRNVIKSASTDHLGNATTGQLSIYVDGTPPQTVLKSNYEFYNDLYVKLGTQLRFEATDPQCSAIEPLNSGIYATYWRMDAPAGPYVAYVSGAIIIPTEGKHTINYYSVDNAGNTELVKTKTIYVDGTPPVSTLTMSGGVQYTSSDGKLYASIDTQYVLSTEDPLINESASGVKEIKVVIASPPQAGEAISYTGPITLPEGIHTIKYYAIDNIGNTETIHTFTVYVDNMPPETTIITGNPKYDAFGTHYISPQTPITLTAVDPVIREVASGVNKIEYRIYDGSVAPTGSTFITYISSFTQTEGKHTIEYHSIDNVNNTETIKTYTVFVSIIANYAVIGLKHSNIDDKTQVTGNIRSNGQVEIHGQSTVIGDVYGEKVKIADDSRVTGQIIQPAVKISSEPIDLTPITTYVMQINDNARIPLTQQGKTALDDKLRFKLKDKDSITLSTGTYYFTKIKICNESTVNITGSVNIICTGGVTVSNGSKFNSGGNAYNLIIYVDKKQGKVEPDKDENQQAVGETNGNNNNNNNQNNGANQVEVSENSVLAAIVYAPYSQININAKSSAVGNFFGYETDINDRTTLQSPDTVPIQTAADTGKIKSAAIAFANTDFKLGNVYSYPNPAKNGYNPTLHIEVGLADSVEIKIFNIAAEFVHDATLTTAPTDKNNDGILEYEYTWDASGVASGVYIYCITATKSGYPPIKVIKKCAVIK